MDFVLSFFIFLLVLHEHSVGLLSRLDAFLFAALIHSVSRNKKNE